MSFTVAKSSVTVPDAARSSNRRLLRSIGDVPPDEYEEQYYQAQNAPAAIKCQQVSWVVAVLFTAERTSYESVWLSLWRPA